MLLPCLNKVYVMLCYVMLCYVMLCYVMLSGPTPPPPSPLPDPVTTTIYVLTLLATRVGNLLLIKNGNPAWIRLSITSHPNFVTPYFYTLQYCSLLVISLQCNHNHSPQHGTLSKYQRRETIHGTHQKFTKDGSSYCKCVFNMLGPFIVISFIKLFSPKTVPKCNKSFKVLNHVSRVLVSSHCAVNLCICFIFVRSFSRELKGMCRRRRSLTTRKVRGESGSSNSCQTELPVYPA